MKARPLPLLAVILVLAGCTSAPSANVTPPPSSSPSPSPTPAMTVVPSSSPDSTDLPVTTAGFSCRLPVMIETSGSAPVSFRGAFLLLPSATFAPDAYPDITSTGGGSVLTTTQTPVLHGAPQTGLPMYDAERNRWLPAGAAQVSAGGAIYAYSSLGEKTIHVVSVATGTERTFNTNVEAPGSTGIFVEEVEGSSVYFAARYMEGPATGLWRLDLSSGAVTMVMQLTNLFAVRDGFAWVGYLDPHDPNPPQSAAGYPLFDSLVRVDLSTGQRTTWDYRPGHSLGVSAANGAEVVVLVFDPTTPANNEIRLLTAPVSGGEDNGELVYAGPMSFDVPWIDGNRVWFGNDRGVYVYTSSSGLQKVYAITPRPGVSLFPAGPCA